jgi:GR25 family glycosyltransferase involved in LPS biosynthesis
MFKEHFDKIFVINLEEATERWQIFLQELKNIGVSEEEVSRFEAIDGKSMPQKGNLKNGELGCHLSHLKIIELAQKEKYERILILEDDVEFHKNFARLFPKYIKDVPKEWDLLYFGGNHAEEPLPFSKNILRVSSTKCTHAYAIHQRMFEPLINGLISCEVMVDLYYGQIQRNYNCYIFYPHIAWQHPGKSYIRQEHVNYESIRKYRTPFKLSDFFERPGDAIRRIAEKFANKFKRLF